MAKNPLTSSERRGITAVAALALLITGGGVCLSRCSRPEPTVTPADVEVLLDGTSLKNRGGDSAKDSLGGKGKKDSAKRKKRQKNDSLSDKKSQKGARIYRQRSLLDERVE